jgi:environmental stress-induced protein Ves
MFQLIQTSEYKIMPWKNGLGTTSEIAIEPPLANFPIDDFDWRLSSAKIQNSNQFSTFKGYDRLLTVWQGEGLKLNQNKLKPFEVMHFSGEENMNCDLLGNEVLDLGLIYKRDKFKANMTVYNFTPQEVFSLKLDTGLHFIFCVSGSLDIDGHILHELQTLKIKSPLDHPNIFSKDNSISILIYLYEHH